MTDEKIIDKVKKLLALSQNNPSVAEAEAAALKAQRLLAEYHIDMSQIDAVEDDDIVADTTEVGGSKKWRFVLAEIVANNFRCKMFSMGGKVAFYGHSTDVAVAKETYEYLFTVAQKGGRHEAHVQFGITGTSAGVYNSYVTGFAEGVKTALDKQCTALMIVVPEDVKSAYDEYSAGFATRRNTVICRGIPSTMETARKNGFTDGQAAMNGKQIEG